VAPDAGELAVTKRQETGAAPDQLAAYARRFHLENPWAKFFNVRIEDMGPGHARLVLPFRAEYTHGLRVVQGGVITSVADAAIAHAIMPMLEPGQACTTVELKINFLAPVTKEDMVAEARVVRKGRQIVLGEADVRSPEGRHFARALATYLIIPSA
jgi:acyl-CoA thioesterase